jgi:hypothetical protein
MVVARVEDLLAAHRNVDAIPAARSERII